VKHDSFWTRWYRTRVRVAQRLRGRDILGVLLLLLALLLTLLGKDPKYSIPVAVGYLVFMAWRASLTFRERDNRFGIEGLVVGGLFDFINKELFGRSNRTRFTLFREAPFRSSHIVPWYRFRRGCKSPIEEAETSMARYKPGEGLTGGAWSNPARNLVFQILPAFSNRHEMELFYINALEVTPETARSISDFMVEVRGIVSYAYLDSRDQFLGLLSLDVKGESVELEPVTDAQGSDAATRKFLVVTSADEELRVGGDSLFLLIRAVGNVLESFRLAERREKRA